MADTSPLKLGLIGCGHIARFHARNIKDALSRQPLNIAYHATCDRELHRARAFADIAGCELVTADAAEVIAACDVVYICTETVEHKALVNQAASAGKHIFCEKPLATSLADAAQMAAQVSQAGVINQVGLILNYSPVFTVLQQLMSADDYGPVLSVHLRDDQFFPTGDHYGSNWRADVNRAGAGTLLEHSIHDVDLLRRLFGDIDAVNCRTREISGHPGIEDVAVVNFHHHGGHTSTLNSVWHAMPSRQSSRALEVFFNRARFTTDQDYFGSISYQIDDQPVITMSSDEVLARFMALQDLEPVNEDLRSLGGLSDRRFLQAVVEGSRAQPDFADALTGHEIVAACYRSAAAQGDTIVLK